MEIERLTIIKKPNVFFFVSASPTQHSSIWVA